MLAIRVPSRSPQRIPKGDKWKTNFSCAAATWVGHGSSGSVFAIDDNRVIKVFSRDGEGQMNLERERKVF